MVFFNLTLFKKFQSSLSLLSGKLSGKFKADGATSFARFQADFLTSIELEGSMDLVQSISRVPQPGQAGTN